MGLVSYPDYTDNNVDSSAKNTESITTLKTNVMLNAFRVIVNGGLAFQNMVDGVADEFEDETGVDTVTSTNEEYDATNDYYHNNPGGFSEYAITSGMLSMNDVQLWTPANLVDDDEDALGFHTDSADVGAWVKIDLGVSNEKDLTKWHYWMRNAYATGATWKIQYSSNDSDWFDASSTFYMGSSVTDNGATWSSVGAKRYWRSYKTDAVASSDYHSELRVYEGGASVNMTLYSNANTALVAPDEAFIVIWQEDVEAITLNTDLKAYASRDGGTTYTQITLEDVGDLSSGRILTGTVDISAQPTGTSMKWEIETLNTKEQKIHGVALEWN